MPYEADILDKVRAKVRESLQEKIDNLSLGRTPTWEDYKYICGYIAAMRTVDAMFDETKKEVLGEKG